ncbi:MAG: hypothetical protein JOZ96_21030 [Acidobacteria bacterium]|nr:hypothetical protein [Acidobacteriota bacterium]MBV9927514.1 hypothetical protein [Acidobacteriota bacterium]
MAEDRRFSWKKEFVVPALLLLFGGLVGVGVGYFWEFFKFKRETLFETRIQLIKDARNQLADVYVELDRLRRQIRADQEQVYAAEGARTCNPDDLKNQREELKTLNLRVIDLDQFSKKLLKNTGAEDNVSNFNKQMEGYLDCLKKTTCTKCTDDYPDLMKPLKNLIDLHTTEISNEIEINK